MRRCCLILWLIFLCKVSRFFHMIRFDIIKFLFNFCLRIEFFCFGFSIDAHIFNNHFKGCGKFRNILLGVNNDEKLFVVYFGTLVYFDIHGASDLRGTSSIPIFSDSLCFFPFNYFNYSCCFSNIWSDIANMAWNLVYKLSYEIHDVGVVIIVGYSVD